VVPGVAREVQQELSDRGRERRDQGLLAAGCRTVAVGDLARRALVRTALLVSHGPELATVGEALATTDGADT
jgi:hypothetical protein